MNKKILRASFLLAGLILLTSAYGLFDRTSYLLETANWAGQSRAQDFINIFLTVPAMLLSAVMASKKSMTATCVWLGTLVFIIYSYILYAFFLHFNSMFLLYVSVLGISSYLLVYSLLFIDTEKVKNALKITPRTRKITALFLTAMAILFYIVWLKDIIPNLINSTIPQSIVESGLMTNGVYVVDLAFLLPAFLIGARLLKKNKPSGYLMVGVLLPFCLLIIVNIAFIVFFLDQIGLNSDTSVVGVFSVLGIISFVVNILFFRKEKTTH